MTSRIEAAIQRALFDWFCKTYKPYLMIGTLNENSRHNLAMGVSVGITDLTIYARKDNILHIFFHELKTKSKKSIIRPSQVKWYNETYVPKLQASNTHYAVSKGLSEAKKEIVDWISRVRMENANV